MALGFRLVIGQYRACAEGVRIRNTQPCRQVLLPIPVVNPVVDNPPPSDLFPTHPSVSCVVRGRIHPAARCVKLRVQVWGLTEPG